MRLFVFLILFGGATAYVWFAVTTPEAPVEVVVTNDRLHDTAVELYHGLELIESRTVPPGEATTYDLAKDGPSPVTLRWHGDFASHNRVLPDPATHTGTIRISIAEDDSAGIDDASWRHGRFNWDLR